MTMVLDDRRRRERPVSELDPLDQVRRCIADIRSTLAEMNDAMDRAERQQQEQKDRT